MDATPGRFACLARETATCLPATSSTAQSVTAITLCRFLPCSCPPSIPPLPSPPHCICLATHHTSLTSHGCPHPPCSSAWLSPHSPSSPLTLLTAMNPLSPAPFLPHTPQPPHCCASVWPCHPLLPHSRCHRLHNHTHLPSSITTSSSRGGSSRTSIWSLQAGDPPPSTACPRPSLRCTPCSCPPLARLSASAAP